MTPSPLLAFLLVAALLLPILTLALGVALGQRLARSRPAAELPRVGPEKPKAAPEHHRRVITGFLPAREQEGRPGGHWRMILVFSWWPGEAPPEPRKLR